MNEQNKKDLRQKLYFLKKQARKNAEEMYCLDGKVNILEALDALGDALFVKSIRKAAEQYAAIKAKVDGVSISKSLSDYDETYYNQKEQEISQALNWARNTFDSDNPIIDYLKDDE